MSLLSNRYGKTALVAGATEGIGEAFSIYLAKAGFNMFLVARTQTKLDHLTQKLSEIHGVKAVAIVADLSTPEGCDKVIASTGGHTIDCLVYNAASSHIGAFLGADTQKHAAIAQTNMLSPLMLVQHFGNGMHQRGRGAMVLMSSLAGFQGSGFLATYAASKAFNTVLAESLWYEWQGSGVDIIACCAGATSTPNYVKTNPDKASIFAPKVQTPAAVVHECFKYLGKRPSIITGAGNRLAGFIMNRLLPRKRAVKIMGDTTRKIYRL
jgi:short-subunit dehydrogenase